MIKRIASRLATRRQACAKTCQAQSNTVVAAIGVGSRPIGLAISPIPGPAVTTVGIDIKPGTFPNRINLTSRGVVQVAIKGSAVFEATQADPGTITLAGASVRRIGKSGKYSCSPHDFNSDGFLDLVCHVETDQLTLPLGESVAALTAKTFGGQSLRGEDTVNVVR